MRFSKQQGPHDDPSILHAWSSENDAWRVEVYRVMFGCRVRARYTGAMDYALDYCFGANQTWIEAGVAVIVAILSGYEEGVRYHQLQELLPRFDVRPMSRDARCWARLLVLADVAPAPVEEIALRIDDYDGPGRDYFTSSFVDGFMARLESCNEAVGRV